MTMAPSAAAASKMVAMALPTLCSIQTRTAKPSPTGISHVALEAMSTHLAAGGEVQRERARAAGALRLAGQQPSEPPTPLTGGAIDFRDLSGDAPCAVTAGVFYAC